MSLHQVKKLQSMNNITINIVKAHIPFIWADDSFSSYEPGLQSAEQKLRTYVGNEVTDSTIDTVKKLVEAIVVKDAFVISAPTLAIVHSGKGFITSEDSTSEPASPESINALAKALRYQVRIAMNALLLALEDTPIIGWENSMSYSLITDGIIPNLRTLATVCKPPAIDDKYKWMEPTCMDFALHWKPQLRHHQCELEKYFGKDVIVIMLTDEYKSLRYELQLIMVELMWGEPKKALWRRNDLMREMADDIESYPFIAESQVYIRYASAKANKHSNSEDSRIYVGG